MLAAVAVDVYKNMVTVALVEHMGTYVAVVADIVVVVDQPVFLWVLRDEFERDVVDYIEEDG